jgi:histidine phosphotransferase ChpT
MIADLRIQELLVSKICHDLVSPVGAINNGVELVTDVGGDVMDEALQLIGNSAQQASLRLKLYRLAYGRAGSEAILAFKDVHEVIMAHFAATKIKLRFAADCPRDTYAVRAGALKILLNMLMLSEEILVYGGEVHAENASEGFSSGIALRFHGRGAALPDSNLAALTGEAKIQDITSRTIHACVTGRLLAAQAYRFSCTAPAADSLLIQFAPN